jgi:hypothetical protein
LAKTASLISGRNRAPLEEKDVKRAINTFMGLDAEAAVRFEPGARTVFRVARDQQTGEEYGEIVFGPDNYPGTNIVDPNSSLDLEAAAAHELTHLYRWRNMQELGDGTLEHLDEALTSLQAIATFTTLRPLEVRQLAADALQRLRLYLNQLEALERGRPDPDALPAAQAEAGGPIPGNTSSPRQGVP